VSNYVGMFDPSAKNNPWNKVFELVTPGSKVLDVGCSIGNFGKALIDLKGCEVDGIEPDVEDYNKASKVLNHTSNATLEAALKKDFRGKKYDFIVFLDVIEHLYQPSKEIALLKDFLNKDGCILFSIPNMGHVSTRLALLDGSFEYGETGLLDKTHLHFYTKKEIENVFNEAGFRIDTWDSTDATLNQDILRSELVKVGITKASNELLVKLQSPEATIFQYIGAAKAGTLKKLVRKQYVPNPQGTLTQWLESRESDLEKVIEEQRQEVIKRDTIIKELQQTISAQNSLLSNPKKLIKHAVVSHYATNLLRRKGKKQ
jgi:2-polyprenyl-3-methyl-5-hydroxy-6-metoxy-1,4-benzoquinol methylase